MIAGVRNHAWLSEAVLPAQRITGHLPQPVLSEGHADVSAYDAGREAFPPGNITKSVIFFFFFFVGWNWVE